MKIKILGSGGYMRTPMPTCSCPICSGAKEDPKKRKLPTSLYLPEHKILIDTAEDIYESISGGEVMQVDTVLYSHWHPDHMAGLRVLESLFYVQKKPIDVWLSSPVDIEKYPGFSFMEKKGQIRINYLSDGKELVFGNLKITSVKIDEIPVFSFMLEEGGIKAVITVDHSKDMLNPGILDRFGKIDHLFMNLGVLVENGTATSLNNNLKVVELAQPKNTYLTHIEGHFFKDWNDYMKLKTSLAERQVFLTEDNEEFNF